MKKILLSLVAFFAASSAFASEPLTIDVKNLQAKPVKQTEGPAFSSSSFAGNQVLDHKGQIVGFDVVMLIDEYDENLAVVRPLAEYTVKGVIVRPVAAVSLTPDGKQVSAGLGFIIPVGKVLDGVELEVGAVAPGANLTDGLKIDGKLVPIVKAKFDFSKALKGVKNVLNEFDKKFIP